MWEDGFLLETERKGFAEHFDVPHVGCHLLSCFIDRAPRGALSSFTHIFWPVYSVKALIVIKIPRQILFQLCFTFPNPISPHAGSVPVFSPVQTSLVPLLGYFFLTHYLDISFF